MMRRPSPPRISRSSPPRRPPPPRSRARRSPSGDDVKIVDWGAPGSGALLRPSRSDRPAQPPVRSRSRSREKRERDHDRHRARDRETRDSRDTRDSRGDNRDRRDSRDNRVLHDHDRDSSRNASNHHLDEVKQKLLQVAKPLSFELQSFQQQSFRENSRFESSGSSHFDNGANRHPMPSNEESFVDPSDFRANFVPTPHVPPLNLHSNQLKYKAPELRPEPRPLMGSNHGNRSVSFSAEKISPKHEKEDERISRLEKLVEKLVETQASSVVSRTSHGGAGPSSFQPGKEPEVFNKKELIPSNTKFTTSMWLNSLHDECLDRGFDEKTCIQYVKSKMTGIIRAWFKTVESYEFTWPELKLLITKTFPDNVDFAGTLRMLVEREKVVEETITQYFFSKMYLCEACKITGENAVSCLIDGLSNPFMKQDIRSCNFLTPEVLYSEYLSKYPEQQIQDRIEREVETYQDFPPPEALMRRERNEYHLELPPRDMPGPPSRGNKPFRNDKCETCKKMGHLAVDCRHAPICYKCNERGHIRAKCPNFVGLLSSAGDKIPFMTTFEIKGKYFTGQIDTGSNVNTIKKTIARNLGLTIVESHETLTGYGGATVKLVGIAEAAIRINNLEISTHLMVVEDNFQDFPLIIGQEFLGKLNIKVVMHGGHVKVYKNDSFIVDHLVQTGDL